MNAHRATDRAVADAPDIPARRKPTQPQWPEAEVTESHPAESHAAESHAAESHAAESHAAELHAAESHAAELHAAELHAAELHAAELHAAEPHAAEPQTEPLPTSEADSGTGREPDTEEIPVQHAEAEPIPASTEPATPTRYRRRRDLLAGTTGVITAALVLLALAMVVGQVLSSAGGDPGPGALDLVAHLAGAGVAILLQRRVDRGGGRDRKVAAIGVVLVAVVVFGVFWWAWLWLFWLV